MGSLFGGSKQTTTNVTKPSGPGKGLVKNVLNDVENKYNNGGLVQPNTTPMVTPFSNQTMRSMDWSGNTAQKMNNRDDGLTSQMMSTIRNGGFNPTMKQATNNLSALTGNSMLNNLSSGNGLTGAQGQLADLANQYAQGNAATYQGYIDNGGRSATGANAFNNLANLTNNNNAAFQNTFDAGGMTADQRNALGQMQNTAGNITNATNSVLAGGGLSDQQRQASDFFTNQMGTQYNNPAYEAQRQQIIDGVSKSATAQAAAAGRYGSGDWARNLGSGLGTALSNFEGQQYDKNLSAQNSAASNLANIGQSSVGNLSNIANTQLGAQQAVLGASQQGINNQLSLNNAQQGNLQGLLGADQQGISQLQNLASGQQSLLQSPFNMFQTGVQNSQNATNQLAALNGQMFNQGQTGFQNMGTAYQNSLMPSQTMAGIGAQNEDLYTRTLNDQARIQNELNNNALTNYQTALGLAGGVGQYNTQTATAQQPGQSPLLTGIGALAGVAGIGNNMGLWGS